MPNWCTNHATITAVTDEAKKLLADYVQYLSGSDESGKPNSSFFDWFHPVPNDLKSTVSGFLGGEEGERLKRQEEENIKKYGHKNWYDFSIAEWGTKWDVDMPKDCVDGDTITFSEETAWSPPIEFYRKMEDLGFEVDASYCEEGAGFYGSYSNGSDESEDIPSLSGPAAILESYYNECATETKVPHIDFSTIKTGDVITAESGETFIYLSHECISARMILDDYPQLEDERLWDVRPSYRELANELTNSTEEIYEVKVSADQTKPGIETCIVFCDDTSVMIFPGR